MSADKKTLKVCVYDTISLGSCTSHKKGYCEHAHADQPELMAKATKMSRAAALAFAAGLAEKKKVKEAAVVVPTPAVVVPTSTVVVPTPAPASALASVLVPLEVKLVDESFSEKKRILSWWELSSSEDDEPAVETVAPAPALANPALANPALANPALAHPALARKAAKERRQKKKERQVLLMNVLTKANYLMIHKFF